MSRRAALFLLPLIYAGYISLGLPDGTLGVAWPRMHLDLAQQADFVLNERMADFDHRHGVLRKSSDGQRPQGYRIRLVCAPNTSKTTQKNRLNTFGRSKYR